MLQLQMLWEHCQASAKCLGLLHQWQCPQDQFRNSAPCQFQLKADLEYRPRLCRSDELHKPARDSQERPNTFFALVISNLSHHKLLQTKTFRYPILKAFHTRNQDAQNYEVEVYIAVSLPLTFSVFRKMFCLGWPSPGPQL